jgi:hypothetical protein
MALNGSLLKTRHKTEIELVLMNVRKCLIEINSLSSKTKAFLIMALDLYYTNFSFKAMNLKTNLEKMYQPYVLSEAKSELKTNPIVHKEAKAVKENGKVTPQASTSRNFINKIERKYERVHSVPSSPTKEKPVKKIEPKSPTKRLSPKELRTKNKSVQEKTSPSPQPSSKASIVKVENGIDKLKIKCTNNPKIELPTPANVIDENVLKQQNACISAENSVAKSKETAKAYFKEENVENLNWNGDNSFDDLETPPADPVSPKTNQYSSSFLNFLSNN